MNDINYSSVLLYIDDLTIFREIVNSADVDYLQIDLNNVIKLASDNGLYLN